MSIETSNSIDQSTQTTSNNWMVGVGLCMPVLHFIIQRRMKKKKTSKLRKKKSNLRILLIRHGQSTNNIHADEVWRGKYRKLPEERKSIIYINKRSSDPELSALEKNQSDALAKHLEKSIQAVEQRGAKIKMFSSAMLRSCMTIHPLSMALDNKEVIILDNIFEVGGIYDGIDPTAKGKTSTASELKARFPHYDVSNLKQNGMWYDGIKETTQDGIKRAARVAKWLRSADLQEEMGPNGLVVIVSHEYFLDYLHQELLQVMEGVNSEMRSKIFKSRNTGYSLYVVNDSKVQVLFLASAPHLGTFGKEQLIFS